jgi:aquaporin Z
VRGRRVEQREKVAVSAGNALKSTAQSTPAPVLSAGKALQVHWLLYCCEASELAIFMFAACAFGVLCFDSTSAAVAWLPSALGRQALFGAIMGAVCTWIIVSPMGRRSGAHFNPACTLTYYRLGRVRPMDAVFYILFQFIGAVLGVGLAALIFGSTLAIPTIDYAASVPGRFGTLAALGAELLMAVLFMSCALYMSNRQQIAAWTPYAIGLLIAVFLVIFGPVSGVGLNPARTTGSAIYANVWTAYWVYLIAPVTGMLLAAEWHVRAFSIEQILCAKLDPSTDHLCPFDCHYPGHRHTWEHSANP